MPKCLICNHGVDSFISFGKMPIANGFLELKDTDSEEFFELSVGYCSNCKMVQLTNLVDREKMFHENYAFFSSTSKFMQLHFSQFASDIIKQLKNSSDPFVVEMGSNDGIMLRHFKNEGFRHLGIEPSKNVAEVASSQGINTICEFFDKNLAQEIIEKYGKADAFLAANVMCHIPYIHSIAEGIKILLKPEGMLVYEDPYLGDIITKTSYDQIYDEHAFYFSLMSVQTLFGLHDLEVFNVAPQDVHGGSMRYYIGHKGKHKISDNVAALLASEKELGLDKAETFTKFRTNVENSKRQLLERLSDLKDRGKRVVGYGATSKSTTVINYCGIGSDLVECICDTTPIKQGKYSPGKHIPVKNFDEFYSNYPDSALLFAWNHRNEIMEKERDFIKNGGKFILYVPEVEIV